MVQSVNRGTKSGTLSTFLRCGLMLRIPRGSFAYKQKGNCLKWFLVELTKLVSRRGKSEVWQERKINMRQK